MSRTTLRMRSVVAVSRLLSLRSTRLARFVHASLSLAGASPVVLSDAALHQMSALEYTEACVHCVSCTSVLVIVSVRACEEGERGWRVVTVSVREGASLDSDTHVLSTGLGRALLALGVEVVEVLLCLGDDLGMLGLLLSNLLLEELVVLEFVLPTSPKRQYSHSNDAWQRVPLFQEGKHSRAVARAQQIQQSTTEQNNKHHAPARAARLVRGSERQQREVGEEVWPGWGVERRETASACSQDQGRGSCTS